MAGKELARVEEGGGSAFGCGRGDHGWDSDMNTREGARSGVWAGEAFLCIWSRFENEGRRRGLAGLLLAVGAATRQLSNYRAGAKRRLPNRPLRPLHC